MNDTQQTEEQIKVMQAFVAGKKIERMNVSAVFLEQSLKKIWFIDYYPTWDWSRFHYRVAPEPASCWAYVDSDGQILRISKEESELGCPTPYSRLVHFVEKI